MKATYIFPLIWIIVVFSACVNGSSLEKLAIKDVSKYTVDDCKLMLNSNLNDIYYAYKVDPENDIAGLLLVGRTLASPIITLKPGISLSGTYTDLMLISKEQGIRQNFIIILFGNAGDKTIIKDFFYGMELDEQKHATTDSFWKSYEAGEELPAKMVSQEQENMIVEIYFTKHPDESVYKHPDESVYKLDSVHASLSTKE